LEDLGDLRGVEYNILALFLLDDLDDLDDLVELPFDFFLELPFDFLLDDLDDLPFDFLLDDLDEVLFDFFLGVAGVIDNNGDGGGGIIAGDGGGGGGIITGGLTNFTNSRFFASNTHNSRNPVKLGSGLKILFGLNCNKSIV